MAGQITVGGKVLASHDNVTDKLSLNSGVIFPAGHIIQVQNTQYEGICSMTGGSTGLDYVLKDGNVSTGTDILNVDITPVSASSKIWLQVQWCGEFNVVNNTWNSIFFIYRNSTKLGQPPAGNRNVGIMPPSTSYTSADAVSTMESCYFQYFDFPNTTLPITYKVGIRMSDTWNAIYTNRTVNDTDTSGYERGISSITAIEIAG